jgi:sterol 3beta-glucosyltransferase
LSNEEEKPVFIGFGSMHQADPKKTFDIIVDAVRRTNCRAILSGKGFKELYSKDISDRIYLLDHAPHDWLFHQVKAVVIHGGAGTVGTGNTNFLYE